MDSFEKLLGQLNAMSEEERRSEIDRMKGECICPDCPTYTECAGEGGERLFCFLGKSPECIQSEQGCICPDCPIADKAGLTNIYFCTTGSEKSMRKEK
jgi:hypothetical protein